MDKVCSLVTIEEPAEYSVSSPGRADANAIERSFPGFWRDALAHAVWVALTHSAGAYNETLLFIYSIENAPVARTRTTTTGQMLAAEAQESVKRLSNLSEPCDFWTESVRLHNCYKRVRWFDEVENFGLQGSE